MIKFIRNNKTISGRLHDEMVMMNIDQGKYFSLNNSATVIWEKLENPLSLEELCEILMEEYDVGKEQCRDDVEIHLNEMLRNGLIIKMEI
jgi:hypothetical protein